MKRPSGIGSSDIGELLVGSPMRLYAEKTGVAKRGPPTEAMTMGNVLEPIIARLYAREHNVKLVRLSRQPAIFHSRYPWAFAHPDYLVPKGPLVEIKAVGLRQVYEWGDPDEPDAPVPIRYDAQCRWQMACTGNPLCDLVVLIGGQQRREYRIERDLDIEERLIELARRFWQDHIEPCVPPPPDASGACADAMALIYPHRRENLVVADDAGERLIGDLRAARVALANAERTACALENQVKALIADNAGIQSAQGNVTWRKAKDGPYTDWRAAFRLAAKTLPKEHADYLVASTTETRPGSRRFIVPRSWFKEAQNGKGESSG